MHRQIRDHAVVPERTQLAAAASADLREPVARFLRKGAQWPFALGLATAALRGIAFAQPNMAESSAPAPTAIARAGAGAPRNATADFSALTLTFASPTDASLQARLAATDAALRARFGMSEDDTAAGVLDLLTGRLAMVRPDAITYAASVPKIAILLAWFEAHDVAKLDPGTRHELGEMIKRSDNELATKYSRPLGMGRIQSVLNQNGFYDAQRGGGLWFGKHYGAESERVRDPVGGHTHAATVRQLLRFYLLLEQGRLISAEASRAMREIFASPEIPHLDDRFVKALAGRRVEVRRKSGWWETWSHDSAVITGPGRHYILVGLTHHARGTEYLEALAPIIDDLMLGRPDNAAEDRE